VALVLGITWLCKRSLIMAFLGLRFFSNGFLDADDFLYVGFGAFAGLVMAL
jgi:hypothetical protein